MNKSSRKILIVDDDANQRKTLVDILQIKGFKAIGIDSGEKALDIFAKDSIALGLIDLRLPDVPGLEVLEKVKKISPETECIVLTGFASTDTAIQAVNLGAYSYVQKPYDVDQLLLTIDRALEKKETAAALSQAEMRYRQLYESALDGIVSTDLEGRFIDFNESYRQMLGYSEKELKSKTLWDITPEKWYKFQKGIVHQILTRGYSEFYEMEYVHKDGHFIPVELSTYLSNDDEGNPIGMWAFCRDISKRKETEETLRRQLEEVTALHEIASAATDAESINELIEQTTKTLGGKIYGDNFGIIIYDEDTDTLVTHHSYYGLTDEQKAIKRSVCTGITGRAVKTKKAQLVDFVQEDPDYLNISIETKSELAIPILTRKGVFGVINAESSEGSFFCDDDLKLLTALANQLATAIERIQLVEEQKQRTKEMSALYDTAITTSSVLEITKLYQNLYEKIEELFSLDTFMLVRLLSEDGTICVDYAVEESHIIEEWYEQKFSPEESGLIGWVVREEKPLLYADITKEELPVGTQQTGKQTRSWLGVPLITRGKVIGGMSVQSFEPNQYTQDHQRLLESMGATVSSAISNANLLAQTKRQIDQLAALHDIDMVINSSLDLRVTLNILLDQVVENLEVDAAAVSLLNPDTQWLEYAAGRGFRTQRIEDYRLRMGEGTSGKAAMERHLVQALNLDEEADNPIYTRLMAEEGFESFYSAPLIAKGQIKGVLDIFNRKQLNPDQEWFNFLETLAGQAAIAIDNTTLLEDLNRSNVELKLAYDTTLEGWSKALDLRDRETEGHTQRVTTLTVKIAQEMGLTDEEIAHIRRGALLHDIGKMGIPDKILHKPGSLNEKEWEVMRSHPTLAHELLYPIKHLRPALEIPYSHHERWDGSGYPQGLRGEEIPLSARIFAVVDVWDALTSDRPYRDAWSEKRTLDYIRRYKGKLFDPAIVDIFLKLIKGEILNQKE